MLGSFLTYAFDFQPTLVFNLVEMASLRRTMTFSAEMKLLIDPTLGSQAAATFRAAGHDAVVMGSETLSTQVGKASKDSRILLMSSDRLSELTRINCGNVGVILLEGRAASVRGIKEIVMPILAKLQQKQLNKVFMLISDDTQHRINFLSYENGHQVARVVVPANCTEYYLHAGVESHGELDSFGIKLAGISHVSPPYEVYRERSDFHLFALVHSGSLEISVAGEGRNIGAGEVLFIPMETPCQYRSREDTTFLWYHLEPERFRYASLREKVHAGSVLNPDILMAYARQYRNEASNIYTDSDAALLPLATLIEQMIRRHLIDLNVPGKERDQQHSLQRAVSALRDDTARVWAVEDLAKIAGCSVPHFHRLTRKIIKRTPHQMIQEAKMQRACDTLIHTDMKLEQIAMLIGYSDAFSFSRAFKQHTGKSPRDYREAHRVPTKLS